MSNRRRAGNLTATLLAFCLAALACPAAAGGGNAADRPGEKAAPAPAATPVHVAFTGGGWRAHTGHAGWTMSLLDDGEKTLDQVFANVETLASNSGGSWFLSMLAYSEAFRESVEAKGAFARYVSDDGYLGQQQRLFRDSDAAAVAIDVCAPFAKSHPFLHFYCRLAWVAGREGVVWFDVVDKVVFEPFGMNRELADTRLGDARQRWAEGKSLVLAATLLTDRAVLTVNDALDELYYGATLTRGGPAQVNVTPVTFSSVSKGRKTPRFLTAGELDARYAETAWFWPERARATLADPLPTDRVPVLVAAAGSSAAAGAAASFAVLRENGFSRSKSEIVAFTLSDLALPVALSPSIAHASPAHKSVRALAASKFVRVADGGYLDNTGVSHLVSFLQANDRADGFEIVAFDNVQTPFQPSGGAAVGIDLANLFGAGLSKKGLCVGAGKDEICVKIPDQQIFAAKTLTGTAATWQYSPDPKAKQPAWLIYTRYAVETVDNQTFAVKGGARGVLHAFTCAWPGAETAPWSGASDFEAYKAMLDGIRTGLQADGGKGLSYLRAALAGSGRP